MATRRINTSEKTHLDQDETKAEIKSDISPAVPSSVLYKLLGFTFAMITFPIGSYFLTRHTIFGGNATYAGGLAALVANVVLISYVVVAFKDDQSEREADEAEKKKQR
ncbi:Vacuolar ATPase assembly integral membrane protein vma21 [Pseudocercospora fuligena]|uniref:Vacuolar ATPase assembly integral membrane protein vma21 n=1 Tax=Pseudocercospora fuligena TaxID=685502 RepID=A0A8H6RQB4_9PEZI|nr:Vacuolar ATPase assembly integral membrane protein vma21 [Pseudocercospora fuligena]